MSSNMAWRVGISGAYWYAAGATIQILFFSIIAVKVKHKVSNMHTFLEYIKIRFRTQTHCIMIFFALMTNIIVTAMLLLGGAATMRDLTGMSENVAAFLLPLFSCWIPTLFGGLKATFVASYIHTAVIFTTLFILALTIFGFDGSNVFGSAGAIHDGLTKASEFAVFEATMEEARMDFAKKFPSLGTFIENDGVCYTRSRKATDRGCSFASQSEWCCSEAVAEKLGESSCRSASGDCIDTDPKGHFSSFDCNEGERCVPSLLTMASPSGLLFAFANIVGNFGTVFVDQSYWQSAVAAKREATAPGFLLGGLAWFIVPFAMALAHGLAGRALTTDGGLDPLYITEVDSGLGLTPARVATHVFGDSRALGAWLLLIQVFMAIISTGSAEIIAVASILTYDVYFEYVDPKHKQRLKELENVFFGRVKSPWCADDTEEKQNLPIEQLQDFVRQLVSIPPYSNTPLTDREVAGLVQSINSYSEEGENGWHISYENLFMCINKTFGAEYGQLLLRVSRLFTTIFALVMGLFAIFLQSLGLSLGFVYMSMGVLIGSAVGPVILAFFDEKAGYIGIEMGAIGGLIIGLIGWLLAAWWGESGVNMETLGKDTPLMVGNACSILGGLCLAFVGSRVFPRARPQEYRNQIPLVDDTAPDRDQCPPDSQACMAGVFSFAFAIVFIIMLPLVLWLSGILSKGSFLVVVILAFMWLILAFGVVVVLPLGEGARRFGRAAEPESFELRNGQNLTL